MAVGLDASKFSISPPERPVHGEEHIQQVGLYMWHQRHDKQEPFVGPEFIIIDKLGVHGMIVGEIGSSNNSIRRHRFFYLHTRYNDGTYAFAAKQASYAHRIFLRLYFYFLAGKIFVQPGVNQFGKPAYFRSQACCILGKPVRACSRNKCFFVLHTNSFTIPP